MHRIMSTFLRSNLATITTSLGSFLFALAIAAGFGFITPKQTMEAIEKHITETDSTIARHSVNANIALTALDTKHQAEIDAVDKKLNQQTVLLLAIARGACLDRPSREWKLMGLDCPRLLRQIGNPDN